MSASGKSLLGLWLYRSGAGNQWTLSNEAANRQLQKKTAKVQEIRPETKSVIFSLKNHIGGIGLALSMFEERGIKVVYMESRKSQRQDSEYEIYMDIECNNEDMDSLTNDLSSTLSATQLKSFDEGNAFPNRNLSVQPSFDYEDIPWFPRKISDLDKSQRVLMYGSELEADHPGFKDEIYRQRRKHFYDIAMSYRHNKSIPRVKYTDEELHTWSQVYSNLSKLYETHACSEYLGNWKSLIAHCHYSPDNIPQLADIDTFLRHKTGFQLRPVAGYLSPRDFLAGLAFRVFHCTQYIRHSSDPFYTPEPDCCHEILGHMPLLANPSFAQFSQEIGLSSLGASDEDVNKLATCYFFTVEFGLCMENGQLKAYGAGLLSSIAELKHALTPSANVKKFDPKVTCLEECVITSYQNVYYYTNSFEEAKDKMRQFAATIQRPFGVRYNPYTQSVDVLSSAQKVAALVSELRGDLCIVTNALRKIHEHDEETDVDGLTNMLSSALPDINTHHGSSEPSPN